MPADLSFVPYFGPILAYFFVILVVATILFKYKILGESKWLNVFVALLIATIFIAAGGVTDYVLTVTPWIAALVISLFFILLLTGFAGIKSDAPMMKSVGLIVVILAGLIFLISAFVIYSEVVLPYVPGTDSYVGNTTTDFLFSPRVVGTVLLLIVAAFASRILIKS